MEHGLRQYEFYQTTQALMCLNPYCNGTWSPTKASWRENGKAEVLILIVMEHGLRRI